VSRELLEKTGGFDPRFRVREDAELSARMVAAGAAFEFLPKAIARQYYFKTNADLLSDAEQFAAADLLLVREHPELKSTTLLGKLAVEPNWKRGVRRVMLAGSGIFEGLLGGVYRAVEMSGRKSLRELGVRALQARRVLRYSRKVRELRD
jgi:GT2 family glycosyltransferase